MSAIVTTVASILVFGVVILIHEFGHFMAARKCGIQVNEFSLGMGPVLFSKTKNGTLYSIRLLPIGGFVSMEGEDGEEYESSSAAPTQKEELLWTEPEDCIGTAREKSVGKPFPEVSVPKRMLVVAAGAAMNFLLGFLILLVLVSSQPYITSKQIHLFTEVSSSQVSGLMINDEIYSVNGHRCYVAGDILYELSRTEDHAADFVVVRDGKKVEVPHVTFDTQVKEDGSVTMLLGFKVYALEKTAGTVLQEAINQTRYYSHVVASSLADIVRGRVSVNDLSGPVGIVSAINTAVGYGWQDLFNLTALLTINLGVFNLLPLPALDGGKMVLLAVEGIIRRPVNRRLETFINMAGMALLMTLMIFVTFQDILRLT